MRHRAAACAALLLVAARPGEAATLSVQPDGSGVYPTIQAAINASVDGDVVELADGLFRGPGNHDLRFAGRRIVLRSASGDPTLCVIDAESSDHILTFYSETPETVVENIALLRGRTPVDGGCIYVVNLGSPTIRGCIIAGGRAARGGGVFVQGTGGPILEGCWILDNEAMDGGGVYATGGSSILLDGCVVAGNRSTGQGGAGVWFGAESDPVVRTTTIAMNEAQGAGVGGGLFIHGHTTLQLDRTIFWENTAIEGSDLHMWDLSCTVYAGCSLLRPGGIGGYDDVTVTADIIADDPEFCVTATSFDTFVPDGFSVSESSPCLPANNGCGTLIGAQPSCGNGTPTMTTSWGGIKSRF